ncbi:MAG: ribosome small subunit-dependent GTPase A, partial [Chitinophagaceae bacterium]
ASIVEILPRNNYVARKSPHNKHSHHIVAANLDQSILFATLKEPKTSNGFIDRFLVACEMYHVPAIIVLNKTDIYKLKEWDKANEWKEIYESIGYQLITVSVNEQKGLDTLISLIENKTSLISGHSGVGKSSFLNHLFPEIKARVQEVSGWSGKGLHTTTFAEMFDWNKNTRLIDTPGIREMGLTHISKAELSGYFPEMKQLINDCQFNNCMHINEPNCAVKEAVIAGKISEERYFSYLNILETIDDKNW